MRFQTSMTVEAVGLVFLASSLMAQLNSGFSITLRVDYASAEATLDFFDRKTFNATRVAEQRGNQLAAATSLFLAREERPSDDFASQLELFRDHAGTKDLYGLTRLRNALPRVQALLKETKRRQLERRVVATLESYFPANAQINLEIPVFVVVLGNERAAAFVRHVVWNNNVPIFVGPQQGEAVIVLNLARTAESGGHLENQFIETLATLAHETFHAVFAAYRLRSTQPANESAAHALADVVQNEGIAYYISLQLHIGGESPGDEWYRATRRAVENLEKSLAELQSPSTTPRRAQELLMNSNLSGSFEGNYGATAGLRMAFEIDRRLGRTALTQTVGAGWRSFFEIYRQLSNQAGDLPRFSDQVLEELLNSKK
ncbi:MAG: DUF5700 domain-containing putative Zn-dependent protease [Bacteroidota bacterium]